MYVMSPTNFTPGSVRGEVPSNQIRHVRRGRSVGVGRDPERARLTRHQGLLAHDLAYQLG